jgi:Raf kinase inhibitor-like YbhB/YbcL family protein
MRAGDGQRRILKLIAIVAAGIALVIAFVFVRTHSALRATPREATMSFALTTPAFETGGWIPADCTCDGKDTSPLLAWTHPPAGTKSFALIVDDPDAPGKTWVHWLLYDLPPDTSGLPENMPREMVFENGSEQGKNDFHNVGYNGPCPPKGKPHRYFFRLYSLDTLLHLMPGANRSALDRAMQGHILGKTELMGRYQRK